MLRRARRAARLTQEELAERASVSARTISDVERGLRTTIYRDTAQRLMEALGLEGVQRSDFEHVARRTARRGPRPVPAAVLEADPSAAWIPIPSTPLIGREHEVGIVSDAVATEEIRLLTLTGPGGIGKTRVAIEAARRMEEEGVRRVFFVPLGGTTDPALVASTVAVGVGVTSPHEPIAQAVAEQLADAPSLLVLDTFEHLIEASPFVGDLLSRSIGLKVLVTSREALHLSGEHEVVVPALRPPDTAWTSPAEDARRNPATRLFIERALAARSDLAIDHESALVVREICVRLNGLPLAIELAAARVKHLSLDRIRDKLDSRLSLLTGGPRDLPRRQRTIRDTVAWSYELLSADEQSLLRSGSVFAGGWPLDGAISVWGDGDGRADALQAMSALVDKSLVFLVDPSVGEPRYSMFDVVRDFALEQVRDGGELESLQQRHGEFYLNLAEAAESQLAARDQNAWFSRLGADHDNLRSALAFFIGQGDGERAQRLAGAVWQFWRREGHISEGRMWLRRALTVEGSTTASRSKVLWAEGWLAFVQGDYEDGEAVSKELLDLARRHGSRLEERNALTVLGMILMSRGRFQEALSPFERGVELCRGLGTSWHLATSHLNLGMAKLHAGDLAGARELVLEARQMYEQIGDQNFVARCFGYLGYADLLEGDAAGAESLFASSLERFVELGDLQGIAEGFEGLSAVSGATQTFDSALRAARLAGVAQWLRQRLTAKQYPFDRAGMEPYLEAARAALGETEWQRYVLSGEL
ncbi:MAG TPA: helix-turn-helix domain-containing protein, partial [Actinomycetota bacterium]